MPLLQLCGWQFLLYGCIVLFLYSDHLMHVRRRLLDFECAIVVTNVLVELLSFDLTTT